MEFTDTTNPLNSQDDAGVQKASARSGRRSTTLKHKLKISNTASSKALWSTYDLFLQNGIASWSLLDQTRLISMDFISRRISELHKCVHTYGLGKTHTYTDFMDPISPQAVAVELLVLSGYVSLWIWTNMSLRMCRKEPLSRKFTVEDLHNQALSDYDPDR